MNEAIVVSHISKTYGKKTSTPLPHREGQGGGSSVAALSDVSFSVGKGEVFGLIGPDGAGKTSMFRILSTLLLADKGTATVDGFDVVKQMTDIRKRVGYMPGRFSLYQDLTVEENLTFFATLFGTTVDEGYDSIKAIYSQIERFKDRKAGALSGGMKQKLALSCALVHQPSVLFLDEPTTGVDPVSRKEFWEMLTMLKERDIIIVASTPYLDEVRQCERVAFLSEGKVMGIDTPEMILDRFKDIFNPTPSKPPRGEASGAAVLPLGGVSRGSLGGVSGGSVIEVSHLVKAFGDFHAVDDISFSVKRGEIFGFLGANGAGKTTAMHMLTGLNQPTSGTGRVSGFDIRTEHEQIKKHIGYMSQRFSLYEDLTVAENIRLFAGIYGMKSEEIKTKTDDLLHWLKFESHKNDLVGSLPLGWKQKLAFSVSIFHDPAIVFLDEPTGGVDPATRQQFWELIYDAAARGITVFVTTHYMDEAEYCDRISIMVDGKISAIGTPEELKRNLGQPDMDHVFTYLARQAKRGNPLPIPPRGEGVDGSSTDDSKGKGDHSSPSGELVGGLLSSPSGEVGRGSFLSFVLKETKHILRDKRTMLILFGMPVVLMLLFGFAITNDVKNVRTVVVTSLTDHQTQAAIERLAASEYFSIVKTVGTPKEAEWMIRSQKADMSLTPTPSPKGEGSHIQWQIMVDGADPNMAQQWTAYAQAILTQPIGGKNHLLPSPFGERLRVGASAGMGPGVRLLYNPRMKSAYNFVPAIMGMLLLLICAMMTSVSIVREKERGTMEVLLVSPIKPLMIIVAKVVPYLLLALVILAIILLMSATVLDVPLQGSLGWIFAVSLIYILLALSLGLLISNIAQTQFVALLVSAMVLLLPTVMLSGMLFPVESMPTVLQWVSAVIPPRYYIQAMRKLMIMGVGIQEVWQEVVILSGMTALLLAISLKKFKTRLE